MSNEKIAHDNLEKLATNPYPGRGLIIGLDEKGEHIIQMYWLMGRSEGSRNRILQQPFQETRVCTEAWDPNKDVGNEELTLYNAMVEDGNHFVVSNGRHSDAILRCLKRGQTMEAALRDFQSEPDSNDTPRIAGATSLNAHYPIELALVQRMSIPGKKMCERPVYHYEGLEAGYGYCITTYAGDAPPNEKLPPFECKPLLVPLAGGIHDIVAKYWYVLNESNRVALAVKIINPRTQHSEVAIKNRHTGPRPQKKE